MAILIFLRHYVTMGGANWIPHNDWILATTSPIMSGFFIVSGFNVHSGYKEKNFCKRELISFYIKRFISIYPLYIFIHFASLIVNQYEIGTFVKISPIDFLMIQTWYNTFFGILHNGGTWFISCLVFAYLIYPIVQELLKEAKTKNKIIILLLLWFISIYSYYLIGWFGLADIYSSTLFRMVEFMQGVLICSLRKEYVTLLGRFNSIIFAFISICGAVVFIKGYTQFIGILIGLFVLVISGFKLNIPDKIAQIIKYISSLCYAIFLSQCIIWPIYYKAVEILKCKGHRSELIAAFVVLFCMAIGLRELYEKPIQRILKKKLLEQKNT